MTTKKRKVRKTVRFYARIGQLGGLVTSDKKAVSSAANGRKGGRPRKVAA